MKQLFNVIYLLNTLLYPFSSFIMTCFNVTVEIIFSLIGEATNITNVCFLCNSVFHFFFSNSSFIFIKPIDVFNVPSVFVRLCCDF